MKCQNPNCENEVEGRARTCSPKCRKALYRLEKPNAKTAETLEKAEQAEDVEQEPSIEEMWDKLDVPENEEMGQPVPEVGQSGTTLAERLSHVETVEERLAKSRPRGPWDLSVARNGKIEYWRYR